MSLFLSSFFFPQPDWEEAFILNKAITSFDQSFYPFGVLPQCGLEEIFFRPLTILYGGNGSGKSTVLNVIAEKLSLKRYSAYNRSRFFEKYTDMCRFTEETPIPLESRIITSDDVFDMILDIRALNEGIDNRRAYLYDSYYQLRSEHFQLRSLEDIEHLHLVNLARSNSRGIFIKKETGKSVKERSNGENGLMYFRMTIRPDTLCLLDEPENSLSPENQEILADYLVKSVRYCGNQLVISTHSPFLLAMPGAKIIDLDNHCRIVDSWTELKNPRKYFDFFKLHEAEFAGEALG